MELEYCLLTASIERSLRDVQVFSLLDLYDYDTSC